MNKGRVLGYCLGWTKNKLHNLKTLALPNSGFHRNLEHNAAASRSLVKMRNYCAATSVYRNMGIDGIPVRSTTLNILMNCFCLEGKVDSGFSLLGAFFKCGMVPDATTFNALLRGLFRANRISDAMELSWKITKHDLSQTNAVMRDHDPEQVLYDVSMALKYLDRDDAKPGIARAMCLQLLGSVCFRLQRFDDSLGYENQANEVLGQLEEEWDDIKPILHAIHSETFIVNKALELKEAMDGTDRDVAEAYLGALKFKEARHYCLKALEMHSKDPLEMACDKRLLDVIEPGYELDRTHWPSEWMEISRWNELQNTTESERALPLQFPFDSAANKIVKGSNSLESGTYHLREILTRTKKDEEDMMYAMIFVSMARELLYHDGELKGIEEVFGESKRWLALAMDILSKNQLTWPMAVAEAYMEMSTLYGVMNECETAMSLLKKAKRMVEKLDTHVRMGWLQRGREEIVVELDARMGWLLFLAGNYESAAAYLEKTIQRMKECFGDDDIKLGFAYNNLGAAYMELHKLPPAVGALGLARDIITKRFRPLHRYSIESRRNLSKAYAAMEDYEAAIKFQLEVLEPLREYESKDYPDDRDDIPLDSETVWLYKSKKHMEDMYSDDDVPTSEDMLRKIQPKVTEQIYEDEQQLEQLERNAPLIGAHIKALPIAWDRARYFELVMYEKTLKASRDRSHC